MKWNEILKLSAIQILVFFPHSSMTFSSFKWEFLRFPTFKSIRFQVIIKYRQRLISTNKIPLVWRRFFIDNFSLSFFGCERKNFSMKLKKKEKHINRNFHVIILTLSSNYFSLLFFFFFLFRSTTISKETGENAS